MRIGIVASSGGSAWIAARDLLAGCGRTPEFVVATDRPCGIEQFCEEHAVPHRRIEEPDNGRWSRLCADWFDSLGGVDGVLLFYLRLVTDELFGHFPTLNIHPSLLPAFPGLRAIKKARQTRVRFLGATLHLVGAGVDSGPIVAQTSMPVSSSEPVERWNKYSFVQKAYLATLALHLLETERLQFDQSYTTVSIVGSLPTSDRCNPKLDDQPLWEALMSFQESEGVSVIR